MDLKTEPGKRGDRQIASHKFDALGTTISLKIVFDSPSEQQKAENDLKEIERLYYGYENQLSRFKADSELSILNSALGQYVEASEEMLRLARKSLEFHDMSGGVFDPRVLETLEDSGYRESFEKGNFSVSSDGAIHSKTYENKLSDDLKINGNSLKFSRKMDFSGIAKGHITDLISKKLKKKGWRHFLVDSGGDIFASGANKSFDKWKVDLEGFPAEKLLITLSDGAVATTGIGKRKWNVGDRKFHHLINPKIPGKYSFDLRSVTVVAPSTEAADVLAKILFLLGKDDGMKWSEKMKIKSIFLDYKGGLAVSSFVKNNLLIKE